MSIVDTIYGEPSSAAAAAAWSAGPSNHGEAAFPVDAPWPRIVNAGIVNAVRLWADLAARPT